MENQNACWRIGPGSKVGIVCCSNGQQASSREQIDRLICTLQDIGLIPVIGDCIYAVDSVFSGTARQRADALMDFYEDKEIAAVFDISGGDLANEVLPYLDYERIAAADKLLWGYSDLTTVINAIYARTQKASVLYQVRNLIYGDGKRQQADFAASVLEGGKNLFDFPWEFVQGDRLEGVIIGGNIRCLLKLAGTPYWPDMTGKVLLLEALSGGTARMAAFLSQLQQIGILEQVNGILLGTFTQMEQENNSPSMVELVRQYVGPEKCVVKTGRIGHGMDSKAIVIGQKICLR